MIILFPIYKVKKNNFCNRIDTPWGYNTMCLLEDDILCFYLIEISIHQLIKNIYDPEMSINKCLDGLFLCSIIDENKNHCFWRKRRWNN